MLTRRQISEKIPDLKIYENEPMHAHTSFGTGGAARLFALPAGAEQIKELMDLCKSSEEKYALIGKGSNILVGDRGFDGVIICLGDEFAQVKIDGDSIFAQAGASLIGIAAAAKRAGLSGLEFACGIPGSLGGAVFMNAGAYGGEMKDIVKTVTVMKPDGKVMQLSGEEMQFGYRHSRAMEEELIILDAKMQLAFGDEKEISAAMSELMKRRAEKQPIQYPSAGSTFKRPQGYFAGKLIEDAGLKGFSIGGAQVSEKHCGFVINKDHASSADILSLCEHIQKTVFEKTGVALEMEVRKLGDF